jgi:hypothetical protein
MIMKNKFLQKIIWLALILTVTNCESYIGGDTNIDPNKTNDASLNTLTPTILFFSANSTQSAASISSSYIQQIGSLVASGTDSHLRSTFDGVWVNLYLNIIPNANAMIKKANSTNSPHYSGLAKVVLAYNLGLATTIWENIPYKSSDNQLTDFAPKYDTQEEVYKDIQRLLNEAITELSATESLFKPGTDDIVYRGNISLWLKTAQTLKARYLLHTAKKTGAAAAYTAILDALSKGIKLNTEDFQLVYTDRNFNPWHSVALANNTGNLSTTFGGQFMNLMNGTVQEVVDPRVSLLAFKNVAADPLFKGTNPGTGAGATTVYNDRTNFFGWNFSLLAPLQMITNAEAKFIEAEVRLLQNGGKGNPDAYNAYLDGIRANMTKIGVSAANITAFTSNPKIAVGAENLTISHIISEKYKALFLNPEAWTDLRRYDYSNTILPGLSLPANHNPDLKGKWIQRAAYPTSETSRNSANATQNFRDLDVKMWIFN